MWLSRRSALIPPSTQLRFVGGAPEMPDSLLGLGRVPKASRCLPLSHFACADSSRWDRQVG